MTRLSIFFSTAALFHFIQPFSMLFAPKMLGFAEDMKKSSPLTQQIFLALLRTFTLTIVATGTMVFFYWQELLSMKGLGTVFFLFLSILFINRFFIQVFVYKKYWPMQGFGWVSHHGLTSLFFYNAFFYGLAAIFTFH
jgi:hypothetical protein